MNFIKLLIFLTMSLDLATLYVILYTQARHVPFIPHPEHPTMSQGNKEFEHHGEILVIGWAFGALAIFFMYALIGFGAQRKKSLNGMGKPLLVCFVINFLIWTWICLLYNDYIQTDDRFLYYGFPLPTTIMLYIYWPTTTIFVFLYMINYEKWVLDTVAFERFSRDCFQNASNTKNKEMANESF